MAHKFAHGLYFLAFCNSPKSSMCPTITTLGQFSKKMAPSIYIRHQHGHIPSLHFIFFHLNGWALQVMGATFVDVDKNQRCHRGRPWHRDQEVWLHQLAAVLDSGHIWCSSIQKKVQEELFLRMLWIW